MKSNIQNWYDNEFTPWRDAMQLTAGQREQFALKVRQHAAELKYIVSLLLEHRGREAVRHWNRLELEPVLRDLSLAADSLTIETQGGEKFSVPIDALLADLQKMVNAKAEVTVTTAPTGGF